MPSRVKSESTLAVCFNVYGSQNNGGLESCIWHHLCTDLGTWPVLELPQCGEISLQSSDFDYDASPRILCKVMVAVPRISYHC